MAYYSDYGQHLWKCGIAWAEPSTWANQRCFLWNLFSDTYYAIESDFIIIFEVIMGGLSMAPPQTLQRYRKRFYYLYLK